MLVASTRQPLLDGARALLAEGADPDHLLALRHAGSEVDALIASSIAAAARLTVLEPGRGIAHFVPWHPFPSPVEPPAACGADPLVGEPGGAGTAPASARVPGSAPHILTEGLKPADPPPRMRYDGIRWRSLRQVFAQRYPNASFAELDCLVEAHERDWLRQNCFDFDPGRERPR